MHLNVEIFIPCHWFILINGKKGYSKICRTTKYHSVGCWFYLLTFKCLKFLAHLEFKNKESKYYFSGSFPHLSLLMSFGIALVSSYLEFIIIIIIIFFFFFKLLFEPKNGIEMISFAGNNCYKCWLSLMSTSFWVSSNMFYNFENTILLDIYIL